MSSRVSVPPSDLFSVIPWLPHPQLQPPIHHHHHAVFSTTFFVKTRAEIFEEQQVLSFFFPSCEFGTNKHQTKDLQRWEWQNVFRCFCLKLLLMQHYPSELNGITAVSYAALHSNKFTSNKARCSTSFSSILRSQHDLEHLSTATFTHRTAETQRICMRYWAKKMPSRSCYSHPSDAVLPSDDAVLPSISPFKISDNGEFIHAPCPGD